MCINSRVGRDRLKGYVTLNDVETWFIGYLFLTGLVAMLSFERYSFINMPIYL